MLGLFQYPFPLYYPPDRFIDLRRRAQQNIIYFSLSADSEQLHCTRQAAPELAPIPSEDSVVALFRHVLSIQNLRNLTLIEVYPVIPKFAVRPVDEIRDFITYFKALVML